MLTADPRLTVDDVMMGGRRRPPVVLLGLFDLFSIWCTKSFCRAGWPDRLLSHPPPSLLSSFLHAVCEFCSRPAAARLAVFISPKLELPPDGGSSFLPPAHFQLNMKIYLYSWRWHVCVYVLTQADAHPLV